MRNPDSNMSKTNLHKRIQELESENRLLRFENERFRKSLGLSFEETPKTQNASVINNENTAKKIDSSVTKLSSPPEEKIELFMSLFRERTAVYANRCYSKKHEISLIYDTDTFSELMERDFAKAEKEILIVSPYLQRKRLNTILEWLKKPLARGVLVTIITRSAETYKEPDRMKESIKHLQSFGVAIQESDIHQKFVLIDNRLVWYSGINLLGYGKIEKNIMRLDSRELTNELKTTVL